MGGVTVPFLTALEPAPEAPMARFERRVSLPAWAPVQLPGFSTTPSGPFPGVFSQAKLPVWA